MDPALLALVAEKNGPDLEKIVSKIGIATLLSLVPNFLAILKTVQDQQKKPA